MKGGLYVNNLFESCGISKTILNYWDNVGYPEGDDAAIIIANSSLQLSQKIERLNSMSSSLSSKLQNIIRDVSEKYEKLKSSFFNTPGYFEVTEIDEDGDENDLCIIEDIKLLEDPYFKDKYLEVYKYPHNSFTARYSGYVGIENGVIHDIRSGDESINMADDFNIYAHIKVPFKPMDIFKVYWYGQEYYGIFEKYATQTTDLDYSDTSICYCEVLNEYFEFNHKHLNVLRLDLLDESMTDKRIEILEAARDIIKNKSGFEYLEYLIYEAKKESNIT